MKKLVFWTKIIYWCVRYYGDDNTFCEKVFNLSEEELKIYRDFVLKNYRKNRKYVDLEVVRTIDRIILAKKKGIKSFDEMLNEEFMDILMTTREEFEEFKDFVLD